MVHSAVWDHFTKDSSTDRATCNICSTSFIVKRGHTSNLWRHMESKHSEVLATSRGEFEEFCEKIIRLITADNAAFRIVERPEFHALFPAHTRVPTRYHLSKVVMPSMVETLRATIRQRLTGKRVTLCVDQWTSKGGKITLSCFNAHYINENGELKSLVIAVPPLEGRHTADNLRAQIEEVIDQYQLDVAAVMSDSASNIRKAVRDMDLFNPRCAAHQLHLAVTNAMSKWSHNKELTKLKDFARSLRKSSTIRQIFFKYCAEFKLDLFGVPQSVETRWGSLFHTITMALKQWKSVNATLKHIGKETLSAECYLMLTKLATLLQPFDEYTKKMCSESCLLTEVAFIFPQIIHNMKTFVKEETGPCVELAELLLAEMEKRVVYYTESDEMKNLLFFDPRAVKVFPYDWKAIGTKLLSSATPSNVPSSSEPNPYSWTEKMFKSDNTTPLKDEIEKYIYECRMGASMKINPLQYWASHAGAFYPIIKEMALKALPIPATSVSAERVFSAAGLLDKQTLRNNLSAETMETCLLLRLNYIGDRARELSYAPPQILVPQSSFSDIDHSTAPKDQTYGYQTDESDFEEAGSDDDEEEL